MSKRTIFLLIHSQLKLKRQGTTTVIIYRAKAENKALCHQGRGETWTFHQRNENTLYEVDIGLNSSGGSRAIELTKDVEAGDKADEDDAHDEDDGGRNLHARSIVGVEPQHVSAAAWSAADDSSRAGGRSGAEPATADARRCCCRAARSDDAGPGGGGGRGLGLRSTSGHRLRIGEEDRNWVNLGEKSERWLRWERRRMGNQKLQRLLFN